MSALQQRAPSREDFAALLEESFRSRPGSARARSSRARSSAIEKDIAVIDVGLKTEGRVAAEGIRRPGPRRPASRSATTVEVYLERIENALGEAVLVARQGPPRGELGPARGGVREERAGRRRHLQPGQGRLHRRPRRRRGVPAAQPGRHPPGARRRPADGHAAAVPDPQDGPPPRQHRRLAPHRARGEPRRAALRDRRRTSRKARSSTAWSRTSPTTARSSTSAASTACCTSPTWPGGASTIRPRSSTIGETVKVQIIKINHETHRISLGMKQLQADPWDGIEAKYPVGAKFTGRVTNITDYGAFVELEPGIEGLIHVSEMSLDQEERPPRQDRLDLAGGRSAWSSRSIRPSAASRSASSRRCRTRGRPSPRSIRSARRSRARSRTRPSSACSSASTATSTAWSTSPTSTGTVPASRRSRSTRRATWSRPRCSTSTSRRSASRSASSSSRGDPFADAGDDSSKGQVVTCEVIEVKDGGIEVKIVDTDLTDLHPPLRPVARPRRAAAGALRRRREGRRPRHQRSTSKARKVAAVDQGAGDRRGEGGGRAVRLDRLRRLARRHPRRGAQQGEDPREEVTRRLARHRGRGESRVRLPPQSDFRPRSRLSASLRPG